MTHKATKRALSQLMESLADELKEAGLTSIGVHNLSPGAEGFTSRQCSCGRWRCMLQLRLLLPTSPLPHFRLAAAAPPLQACC